MDNEYLNYKSEIEKSIKELRSIFETHSIHEKLEKNNQKILETNFGKTKQIPKKLLKKKNCMKN